MNIKIGDKVRFLNSVGGGEVIRFINKELVSVLEDDGFETPVLAKECVVVESNNRPIQAPRQTEKPIQIERTEIATPEEEPEETKEGDILNVFLAYVPLNPQNMQETAYDTYLLNDSNYYLMVNFMCKQQTHWVSRYNGIIEPNTQAFIENVGKEQLNDLERITVQLIAYKKKAFDAKNAYSIDYKIDTVKFYKLHSFKENLYFDEKAMLLPLVENDLPHHAINITPFEIGEAIREKESKVVRKKTEKQNQPHPIIEVDLHIHALIDNTNGLANKDMLQYQLDKFNETMQNNLRKKGQKIVFIHGKGEGVLRNALLKELKNKYKHCEVQDASFREYGFGATMVTIR